MNRIARAWRVLLGIDATDMIIDDLRERVTIARRERDALGNANAHLCRQLIAIREIVDADKPTPLVRVCAETDPADGA
jgi:hypothetical protein